MDDYYAHGRVPPPPRNPDETIAAVPARILAAGLKDGFSERRPGFLQYFPFTFSSLHWASAAILLSYASRASHLEGVYIAEPQLYDSILRELGTRPDIESIEQITTAVTRERARGPGPLYETARSRVSGAIDAVNAMFASLGGKTVYGLRRGDQTIGIRTTKAL